MGCCDYFGVGCGDDQNAHYDCGAGVNSYSAVQKRWCCKYKGVGCKTTEGSLPFDCDAGFANWERGWSIGKKKWCCKQTGRACHHEPTSYAPARSSAPYDCD